MEYKKDFINIVKNISGQVRLSGTRGEIDTVKYIKRYINKNIGGKSLLQKFKILTWRETKNSILIINNEFIECRSFFYSPKSNIKGRLEYFFENNEEKGNEFDVYCLREKRNKTIIALLYVSKNYENSFYYNQSGADYLMPGAVIGSKYGEFFKKNIGKEVYLKIFAKYVIKNSYNLIHKLSNRKNKLKLVIGAHIDTVPNSRGVIDNASGVAAALIISKAFKKIKLPFDIWVVYFGAEENSMFGSKFFVDTLPKEQLGLLRYMISIDGLGIGDMSCIYAEKDYFDQIIKKFEQIKNNIVVDDVENMLDASDHYYFKLSGIDSCFIEGMSDSFYCHNKEANEFENLNVDLSLKTIDAIINFIKDINFKSPNVVFENKKGRMLKYLLRFLKN